MGLSKPVGSMWKELMVMQDFTVSAAGRVGGGAQGSIQQRQDCVGAAPPTGFTEIQYPARREQV